MAVYLGSVTAVSCGSPVTGAADAALAVVDATTVVADGPADGPSALVLDAPDRDVDAPGAPDATPDATPADAGLPDASPDGAVNPFQQLTWTRCAPYVPPKPAVQAPDLDLWLSSHPIIANAMQWQFYRADYTTALEPWSGWPDDLKELLRQNFRAYWTWYGNDMAGDDPSPLVDPPVNLNTDANPTIISEADAKTLYAKTLAQLLVVELQRRVPWSILDDDAASRQALLDSRALLFSPTTSPKLTGVGYALALDLVTPGSPLVVARLLKANGMPCATRLMTIGRLLTWANRLAHFEGGITATVRQDFWQYSGAPPVTRILAGTVYSGPDESIRHSHPGPEHWTFGCVGTSGLLKALLRGVNIPAEHLGTSFAGTGHGTVHFVSEKKYLSHGDDPYFTDYNQLPFPPEALLISEEQYQAWFASVPPTVAVMSVGRAIDDLRIAYLTKDLLLAGLADKQLGLGHADSVVYHVIAASSAVGSYPYPVGELEQRGLWARLDQLLSTYGAGDDERLKQDLAVVPDYQPGPEYPSLTP